MVKELKHRSKVEVDKTKSEDKLQDRYHDIQDKAEERRIEQEREAILSQFRDVMQVPLPQEQPEMGMPQQPEMGMPQQQPMMPKMAKEKEARIRPGSPLDEMIKAKKESDVKRYDEKHNRMRKLIIKHPEDFFINVKEKIDIY